MMKKAAMIGVLSGFVFLAAAPLQSYADPCGCGGPGWGKGGHEGMMHGSSAFEKRDHVLWKTLMRLDLSEQQKEALAAIRSRVEKETIRKRADLEVGRLELHDLLRKDPVDMKAVEANLKKAEAVRTDLRLSHIKAREEVKAQLTPEQRAKLKEQIRAGSAERNEHGACAAHERMHGAGSRPGGE